MVTAALRSPDSAWFDLGPLTVHGFTVCVGLGTLVALVWAVVRLRQAGKRGDVALSVLLWAAPLAVVGGRIEAVLTSPGTFFGNDGDARLLLSLAGGGLGVWGVTIGGLLGLWLAAWSRNVPLARLSDVVGPPVLVGAAIAVWGEFFSQERFGGVTGLPWGWRVDDVVLVQAGLPTGSAVQPLFLYFCLWLVCGTVAVTVVLPRAGRGKEPAGVVGLISAMWLMLGFAAVSWLRQDVPAASTQSGVGTVLGCMGFAASLVTLVVLLWRARRRKMEAQSPLGEASGDEGEVLAESPETGVSPTAVPSNDGEAVELYEAGAEEADHGTAPVAEQAPPEKPVEAPESAALPEPSLGEPNAVQGAVEGGDEAEGPVTQADAPEAVEVAEDAPSAETVLSVEVDSEVVPTASEHSGDSADAADEEFASAPVDGGASTPDENDADEESIYPTAADVDEDPKPDQDSPPTAS